MNSTASVAMMAAVLVSELELPSACESGLRGVDGVVTMDVGCCVVGCWVGVAVGAAVVGAFDGASVGVADGGAVGVRL